MQWLPTRFYGSLSVYGRPLPSEKNSPLAAQLKIAFHAGVFRGVPLKTPAEAKLKIAFRRFLFTTYCVITRIPSRRNHQMGKVQHFFHVQAV